MPYIPIDMWTDEFIQDLNENQHNGKYDPIMCAHCKDTKMVASKDGWTCPTCDYKIEYMIT